MILNLQRVGVVVAILCAPQLAAAAQDFAAVGDPLMEQRLVNPELLVEHFAAGEADAPVIVNLAVPDEIRAFSSWSDPIAAELHRETIAVLQDAVIVGLPAPDFEVRHRFENQATFSGEATRRGVALLLTHQWVESVEYDLRVYAHTDQGITLMNGDVVRSKYDGSGLSIAVVDTGIDYTHSALGAGGFPNAKVLGGFDFGDVDADPMDQNGHGTSVAGIAAGDVVVDGDYIGGVAPGARLYALKIVAGGATSTFSSTVAAAWDWCITHQFDDPANPILLINTSFGGGKFASRCNRTNPTLAVAAANCTNAGIAVFVSSGNDGYCSAMTSPGCVNDAISVGGVYDATLGNLSHCVARSSCVGSPSAPCSTGYACSDTPAVVDAVTCYSNSAGFLDLLAPSNNAWSPTLGGGYEKTFGGTSAAVAYAVGGAALLVHAAASHGITLSPAELRAKLVATGDSVLDSKSGVATPRVNLGAAVDSLSVWVDFAYVGPETGSESQPFNTFAEGVAAVSVGGILTIKAGTSTETGLLTKPMFIVANGGTAKIGL